MGMNLSLSPSELHQVFTELNSYPSRLKGDQKSSQGGRWKYLFNGHIVSSQERLSVLIQKINQAFSHLEQAGVKIFDPSIIDFSYQEKVRAYRLSHQIYFDIVNAIRNQMVEFQKKTPEFKKAYHELECREVGWRYSLGEANGGWDALKKPDEKGLADLKKHAEKWKKEQKQALNSKLDFLQEKQLEELACYPEWLKVIYKNSEYLSEVFDWCLRDFNQVEVIIKCYETRQRIKKALLSANLGYVRNPLLIKPENEVLAFKTLPTKVNGVAKRILTFSIYHGEEFEKFDPNLQERINILKLKKNIHFKQGNYTLTVEEFFKELGQKNQREAKFSLCGDWGFTIFHPVKKIYDAKNQCYKSPSMSEKKWIPYIPFARRVSDVELVQQYGDKIKGLNFFFKVMASRKSLNLNALDCHAFWQFYLRMEDGNWKVLNIGSYAHRFPQSQIDGAWLFCSTMPRVLCLMDQNGYYTHRQRGGIPFFPNEKVKEDLFERLYRLMCSNGVFQFAGRNCAYSVQSVTQECMEGLPNFFLIPLTKSTTGIAFLDRILAWAGQQWEWVRWLILSLLHTLLLSHRNIRIKEDGKHIHYSVKEYFKKYGHQIYNPSYLLYQIAEAHKTGKEPFAEGEIYWSHTDEKLFQIQTGSQPNLSAQIDRKEIKKDLQVKDPDTLAEENDRLVD